MKMAGHTENDESNEIIIQNNNFFRLQIDWHRHLCGWFKRRENWNEQKWTETAIAYGWDE